MRECDGKWRQECITICVRFSLLFSTRVVQDTDRYPTLLISNLLYSPIQAIQHYKIVLDRQVRFCMFFFVQSLSSMFWFVEWYQDQVNRTTDDSIRFIVIASRPSWNLQSVARWASFVSWSGHTICLLLLLPPQEQTHLGWLSRWSCFIFSQSEPDPYPTYIIIPNPNSTRTRTFSDIKPEPDPDSSKNISFFHLLHTLPAYSSA